MLKKTQIINFVLDQPNGQIRRKDLIHFICNLNGIYYDPVSCRGYYSVALQDTTSWWRRGGFLMFSSKKEPRHLYRVRRGVFGVKDAYGNVLGQNYPHQAPLLPEDKSYTKLEKNYDSMSAALDRGLELMNDEYEKPVTGQYDSATSADFRTPRMKNEQATYDLNKSIKKLAEEEDKYNVPRPIVTFGLKGDDIYVGLTNPKGDTMWIKLIELHRKLDKVLNFNYFNNNC